MFSKTDTAALPVVAVIAAAGSGTRLGADQPKAFVELAGRTLVERALDGLASSGVVGRTFVMISLDMQGRMAEILD
ncbi:2-C-methyl-D-erythritol 4-phosphate cytidylyltransferase, partial [Corynebacterium sp.]|uniref:2-C-methyl-D-erythritol 4-phosphate cytidylyltransferase n=1 Tax=Corynebacterium sp. TaxID=1720 RepID=UPI002F3EFB08